MASLATSLRQVTQSAFALFSLANVARAEYRCRPFKTNDAYMLIYVRRDDKTMADEPKVPELARKAVDALDQELQQRCETFEEKCAGVKSCS